MTFSSATPPHNTWRFYKEQTRDPILAYAVELTGVQDGKITGNLYELDYEKHYERVKDNTVDAGTVTLVYEHGTREQPAEQHFNGYPDPQLGKFEYFEVQPKDPEALQSLLREEKHSRDKLTPGDLKEHIAALHEGMIEHEARRIVADMKKLSAPNSPDKSHFMVELSPSFERLASTKDTERLFSMLPYKTLAFSQIKNSSNVVLDSFYWRDQLPAQVTLSKIVTGSYNQPLSYKVVYKTNLSGDYRTLADNLSTSKVYVLDARPAVLGLAANERVTEVMFVFGNVKAGFAQVETPYIYATARSGLANNSSIVNVADVGGLYNGQWIQAVSHWLTTVYTKTTVKLPKTGY